MRPKTHDASAACDWYISGVILSTGIVLIRQVSKQRQTAAHTSMRTTGRAYICESFRGLSACGAE